MLFLITIYEWFKISRKNNLFKFLGTIFILFSFYSSFVVREEGLKFFLLIVIICVFTDIGGYMFGKFFKGPKLSSISPNKTYSGVIGSFTLSLIFALIFIEYLDIKSIFYNNYLILFIMILFISLISQIGDLIISFFKRKARLKDSGKILPGHGGLLDRIDGLIFVMPIIYFLQLFK
tara:strand:- start:15 stop:545 length:531 start_codon:yes stop_codon:yes gene_type:complete